MKLFFSIVSFFVFVCFSYSQNVTIKGSAPAYKGKEITLYGYDDLITYTEKKLNSSTINDEGNFELRLNADFTQYVFLKINKINAGLYITPNSTYQVVFPPEDSSHVINNNIERKTDLIFSNNDSSDLNSLIIDFNKSFEIFWSKNYQYFVLKHSGFKLDSFKLETHQKYTHVKNPYFHTYIDYSIASIEKNTFKSEKKLATDYIIGKPIYHSNYEYMTFLTNFFKQYLQKFALSKEGEKLIRIINEQPNYRDLMEFLAIDKYLKNDTLRELILLKGLSELYYVPDYNKENIISITEQIKSQSKIAEHKKIAANIIASFSKMKSGTKAPDFSLRDKNGTTISLNDFKGKYIYLDFWATWCTPCLQEMKMIPQLKKKYGNKIVFVSISIDDSINQMNHFLSKNQKYDWVFLHCGREGKTKEDYNIKTVPYYFLIDPKGNFIQSPAKKPSENIEDDFYKIVKKKPKLN